jgi:hypothetical protein
VEVLQSERKGKRILWFEELGKEDIPLVGGKNANLGEMLRAKISVPPGYAITAHAYHEFITKTGIAEKIYKTIEQTVTDVNDPKQYEEASKRIRKLLESTPMPSEIAKEIKAAYSELDERIGMKDVFVAVRSSATAEDLPDASFAGQQETFLNVKGKDDLIDATRHILSKSEILQSRTGPDKCRRSENGKRQGCGGNLHAESSHGRTQSDCDRSQLGTRRICCFWFSYPRPLHIGQTHPQDN